MTVAPATAVMLAAGFVAAAAGVAPALMVVTTAAMLAPLAPEAIRGRHWLMLLHDRLALRLGHAHIRARVVRPMLPLAGTTCGWW